jgi:hypothetical protein
MNHTLVKYDSYPKYESKIFLVSKIILLEYELMILKLFQQNCFLIYKLKKFSIHTLFMNHT